MCSFIEAIALRVKVQGTSYRELAPMVEGLETARQLCEEKRSSLPMDAGRRKCSSSTWLLQNAFGDVFSGKIF